MTQLDLLRRYSTCHRGQVAAGLIDSRHVLILSAPNGTPSGQTHCIEGDYPDGRCVICIHAETNLLNKAARLGVAVEGLSLYTTCRPCISCANNIIQAGISSVYWRFDYTSETKEQEQYVLDMFNKHLAYWEQLKYTTIEQEFNEMLDRWMQGGS